MPFADKDFIKLNLPPGVDFSVNGVTMTVDSAAQNALDEGGSREMALSILFGMLESDQFKAEMLDRYSYQKWDMRGSEYWRLQAASKSLNAQTPSVLRRHNCFGSAWRGGCP